MKTLSVSCVLLPVPVGFILFKAKVEKIRANVGSDVTDVDDESSMFHPNQVTSIRNFIILKPGDVEKIIMNFPSKTCSLDSIHTWLVKDNLHTCTLLPIRTKVVNSSPTSISFSTAPSPIDPVLTVQPDHCYIFFSLKITFKNYFINYHNIIHLSLVRRIRQTLKTKPVIMLLYNQNLLIDKSGKIH